ncbi:T3SS transcriptional regulator HrpB [soil metagenome]
MFASLHFVGDAPHNLTCPYQEVTTRMIYPNYLAAIQILRLGEQLPRRLQDLLAEDRHTEAATTVREALSTGGTPLFMAQHWQLLGDIQLLIGNFEAVETIHEKSLALMDGHPLLSSMSCRATGLLMLVRGRLETASRCFVRNLQSPDEAMRLEALAICALLFREGGMLREAASFAMQLLGAASAIHHDGWRSLAHTPNRDIAVYRELLSSPRLHDHVYWHASPSGASPSTTLTPSVIFPNVPHAVHSILEHRQRQLTQLLAVAHGETAIQQLDESTVRSSHPWPSSAAWSARMSLQELALAALAGGQPAAAARLLARVPANIASIAQSTPIAGVVRPAQIEFAYCMAKSMMERGQPAEGLALYRRYLKVAMDTIRSLAATLNQLHDSVPSMDEATPSASNDPVALLPQRYRRAYEYLRQHHGRGDLSVHEVAASIGVSERALQMRFKSVLGISPREAIQQLRAHR